MLCYIIIDLLEFLPYFLLICLGSVILLFLFMPAIRASGRTIRRKQWVFLLLFLVYLGSVAYLVWFSREPGSRNSMDLEFLQTWGTTARSRAYVIENVLMTIPLGILLPLVFPVLSPIQMMPRVRSWIICTGIGCLFSLLIEGIQMITQMGFCQLDDVVMNTVGTSFGWCIGWLLITIWNQKSEEQNEIKKKIS